MDSTDTVDNSKGVVAGMTRALVRSDLDDFVACFNPASRQVRSETERFRSFTYDELVSRDKASLDIFWLGDESLEDSENLSAPEVIGLPLTPNLGLSQGTEDEAQLTVP
jgi:type I restriction enzyme M protein